MGTKRALLIALIAAPLFADQSSSTGRQFLLLPQNARESAMGGSFSALDGDALGVFSDPAGLASLDRGDLGLSHLSWFGGANMESVAYAQPAPGLGTLGGGLSLYWMHPFDNTGGAESPFSALGYEARLGAAARLPGDDRFAFGASLAYVGMDLGGMDQTHDLLADLGVLYRTGWEPLRLGVTVRDIGLLTVAGSAPALSFRAGAILEVPDLLVALEAVRVQDQSTGLQCGGEYRLGPISLRAGLGMDDSPGSSPIASFGAGFELGGDCRLDYAASDLADLGLVQWISVALPLGAPMPSLAKKPAAPVHKALAARPVPTEEPTPEEDPTASTVPSKPVPALAPPYRKSYDIFQKALAAAPSKSRHTPIPAPFASTRGFALTANVQDGQVELSWPKSDGPDTAYDVYVSIVPGADFRKLNQAPLTQPRWSGEMGLRGMTYYFRVKAAGASGDARTVSEVKGVDVP